MVILQLTSFFLISKKILKLAVRKHERICEDSSPQRVLRVLGRNLCSYYTCNMFGTPYIRTRQRNLFERKAMEEVDKRVPYMRQAWAAGGTVSTYMDDSEKKDNAKTQKSH